MKDWVQACLELDARFQDVAKEPIWKGAVSGQWRRPDVRATYLGIPVAFEIQLSTTYLDVIVARRQFYLEQGGLLFWIFASFDNEHRRMTDEDVFYNNNQNIFIVSADTVASSAASDRFMLECVWAEPTAEGGTSALHRKLVGFDELTLQPKTQRAYYFDFEGLRQKLADARTSKDQVLRDDFEAWWAIRYANGSPQSAWLSYARRLGEQGVPVPADHRELDGDLLTALYSAKHNRPFGQRRKKLVEVAHHVATAQKQDLTWFMHAVRRYDRLEGMVKEGNPSRWADKYRTCRQEYSAHPERYEPSRKNQKLVEFLFPELQPFP